MAIETEKRIKKWSKAKKRALIAGEYDELPNLWKRSLNKDNGEFVFQTCS